MQHLNNRSQQMDSLLCLGLDFDPTIDPVDQIKNYDHMIWYGSRNLAAVKFNLGTWLLNPEGLKKLCDTAIHAGVFIIIDGKFGDISTTSEVIARYVYKKLGADAVTVNSWMGDGAVRPFLIPGRGAFVLAKSSEALGQFDSQNYSGTKLTDKIGQIASLVPELGAVVGVSGDRGSDISEYRELLQNAWILCPGIGAQGADLTTVVRTGMRKDHSGILINIGRGIRNTADPIVAIREWKDKINKARE